MCKKQTSVSHSSTESEIISLDTGLRLDGLLALELWDLIVSVFRCGTYSTKKSIWENQHLSWITYTWAALKDNAKEAIVDNYRTMFESRISAG